MTTWRIGRGLLCAASWSAFILGAAPGAGAQTATPPSDGLQEIVVTAQKRTENLQNVPISVTAVTGAAVDNLHIQTLQGLQGMIPNVQIDNFSNTPNTAVVTIRGIGVVDPDPYAGNTVSIVVDGVPQFFSIGALVDLYDIERIEVLRGPQGTLFGANTTGGVVNIVTKQPTGELGGQAQLSYGNYNQFNAAGTLNFPIVDGLLAGKIAISHDQSDGFVRNIVDGSSLGRRDVTIYRGYLKFTPAPNFDATFTGEYDRGRNGAAIVINGALPGEGIYVAPGVQGMYPSVCQVPNQPCHANSDYKSALAGIPDLSNLDTYRASLTMNWRETPIGNITSITAYKHFSVFEFTDQDGTPLFLSDTRRDTSGWQFSQELRSSRNIGKRINVIYGAFYQDDHYDHLQNFRIGFVSPGLLQINTQHQDNDSISAFAHGFADITSNLRLQAGIRFTHETTSMLASTITSINLVGKTDFDGTGNVVLRTVAPPRGTKSWDNVGWKLGADYRIGGGPLVYAYWARGFKSGGFAGRLGIPQDLGPYNPEKVDTYEIGTKTDLLDHHLRVNVSGFYTNYQAQQIAQIYFDRSVTPALQGNTILNAAKSEIKGFEAELTALPAKGLVLTGSAAYLDAKYKDFPFVDPLSITPANPSGTLTNLKGKRLLNAPEWTAGAGATYTFDLGPGHLSTHIQYNYTASKYLSAVSDTPRSLIQSTDLVDGNMDYVTGNGRYTIGVWARNLLDNRYLQSNFDNPGYGGIANYAAPGTFGATVKAQF